MKVSKLFDYLYCVFGIMWLFMVIATSNGFTAIKILLLLLLCVLSLIEMLVTNKKIYKNHIIFVVVFVSYFFFCLLIGIKNGYEFSFLLDFSLMQYYVITPICVLLLYQIFKNNNYRTMYVIRVMTVITAIVMFLDIAKILAFKGIIPDFDYLQLINIYSAQTQNELALRVANESSFMFLCPLFCVLFFREKVNIKHKILYCIIIFMSIVYSIISGRKMLILILAATILLLFLLNQFSIDKRKRRQNYIFVIIGTFSFIVILNIGENMNISNILEMAYNTVNNGLNTSSYGMSKRIENAKALIDMWLSAPIIGNGLNSYAIYSLANNTTKWSYEVVYIALLAQTGLVGISIFICAVQYIVRNLYHKYRQTKKSIYFAMLIGFASFVFAGSTNPMIYFVWPWAISLIVAEMDI